MRGVKGEIKMDKIIKDETIRRGYFLRGERYILKYRDVYQLFYSQGQGFLTYQKLYHKPDGVGITLRGRFVQTGDEHWINKLVGFELLRERN